MTAALRLTCLIIACSWQTFVIRIFRLLGGFLRHGPLDLAFIMPCFVSNGTEYALRVPDCSRNLASVPCFSQQEHDVRLNEEHPSFT